MVPISYKGILLPDRKIDLYKWAVVACDQYTSDPNYWKRLDALVGDAPSTLRMILPECYINSPDCETRIGEAAAGMREYFAAGLFRRIDTPVLTERTTAYGRKRKGLVLKIRLDDYEYAPGNYALIRATEGTIAERIPPRVKIRKFAPLELPHVMLLIDDPADKVFGTVRKGNTLYDTDLNMNGGHITGSAVSNPDAVTVAFEWLKRHSEMKYGQPLLFLVGDGNHSLATAKACLKARRKDGLPVSEYALVEVVNIYDEGLVFEPIHRLLDVDGGFIDAFRASIAGEGHTLLYTPRGTVKVSIPLNAVEAVRVSQEFIDRYLAEHGGAVDYVHGVSELKKGAAAGKIGLAMPAIQKSELFPYVATRGILPRKTFSMGEADEKRYYMEAARIDCGGGD
ncbi:MAG: DUF1015 domain-containing protein [Clostridia bacterium]|jgi:hypothetical protein|nr:DUF1015 domain-containing protein [Clostridia bacterium]